MISSKSLACLELVEYKLQAAEATVMRSVWRRRSLTEMNFEEAIHEDKLA